MKDARHINTTVFPLFNAYSEFTNDTVMTIAVAEAILHHGAASGRGG